MKNLTNDKILEIKDLYVKIKNKNFYAVNGLNLSVYRGKILGIVGESGSGKSMTALSIMGLLRKNIEIEKGDIIFENTSLQKISMIFQDPTNSLNPLMKIGKQVAESAKIRLNLSKQELKELTLKAMNDAGLKDAEKLYNSYPHELSGGMKQRAMIASCIIANPDILIADEPTTALDVTVEAEILKLLKKLSQDNNMAMIFISHNIDAISKICDYIAVMKKGYLVEYGETLEILKKPKHEYTKTLIQSVITPEKKGSPL
ncbi:MAG: ABC transporter ATP-binding protein [Defluviitaleaceae bacterium]|nr:ABC transporter ATP-binding protein [Defluviitaleaceae bacterium]